MRHYLDARNGDLKLALGDYYSDNIFVRGKPTLLADFSRNVTANSMKWKYDDVASANGALLGSGPATSGAFAASAAAHSN